MDAKYQKLKEDGGIQSFFGFDYAYRSNTDDEEKYYSKSNKRFFKKTDNAKRKHIMRLWKKAYNMSFGCAILITQFISVHTKVVYFGRQVLGVDDLKINKDDQLFQDI